MLMAVFAMSAVAASVASAAAPEFKPSTKQAFTGASETFSMYNDVGEGFTCSKVTSTGEITGATTVGSLVLTFTGCEGMKGGGTTCKVKSVGANAGEIITKPLKGELGEVATSEATSGVGLLIEPASGEALTTIAKGECYNEGSIEGRIAAEVTPIKTLAKTGKLVFVGSSGSQKIKAITVKGVKEKPSLSFHSSIYSWGMTDTLEFMGNALEVT